MNEKELIRSEILKMKDQTVIGLSEYDCGHENGANEMCDKILAFIDTLPGEPLSDDMEVEFGSYLQRVFKVRKEGNVYKTDGLKISPYDLANLACYFANWERAQMMKGAIEGEIGDITPLIEVGEINNYLNYVKAHGLKTGTK